MSVSGISSNAGSTNDTSGTTAGRETKLGQDAFMRLLTTQLANQDPLKPQENGEFIAQLATFSSLEKLTSIETSIKELATAFKTLAGTPETPTDGTGSTGSGAGN